MTQEDRELLLRDIMMRASYGVICYYSHKFVNTEIGIGKIRSIYIEDCLLSDFSGIVINSTETGLGYIKPYLRSLSDMTEEEIEELKELCSIYLPAESNIAFEDYGIIVFTHHLTHNTYTYKIDAKVIDWLLFKHFDFRGLIEKNLAIRVTKENNPYEKII